MTYSHGLRYPRSSTSRVSEPILPNSNCPTLRSVLDSTWALYSNTVKAWLNGEEVGPINPEDASIDILPKAGRNRLIVQIGTTMLNSINSYNASELAFLGATRGRLYRLFQTPLPENQVYGLVGPVVLTPFGGTMVM